MIKGNKIRFFKKIGDGETMKRILITGALGQIGTELTTKLRKIYGFEHVIATDIRKNESEAALTGPFEILDVTDLKSMIHIASKYHVDTIIHLAAILSATAETKPLYAWNLNMGGLLNALETTRELDASLFTPSSIAVFGPDAPKDLTSQNTIMRPTTMYGVNKVAGELLCDYFHRKYSIDTRGLRFPGLISCCAQPGGGTTDYAVEIFYQAIKKGEYTCYLEKGTHIDMMYMPDAINAIITLMEADPAKLCHRSSYNVTAMSLSPQDIAEEISKHIPDFRIRYDVDPIRQSIAESWPNSIDASAAKQEWGFKAEYDLEKMTKEVLQNLKKNFYKSE